MTEQSSPETATTQSLPPSPHVEYVASRGQSKITYWVSREEGDRIRAASVTSTHRHDGWPPQFEQLKLQARAPDGGEWTDIFPAQLGAMAKNGCDVRALEAVTRPDHGESR